MNLVIKIIPQPESVMETSGVYKLGKSEPTIIPVRKACRHHLLSVYFPTRLKIIYQLKRETEVTLILISPSNRGKNPEGYSLQVKQEENSHFRRFIKWGFQWIADFAAAYHFF